MLAPTHKAARRIIRRPCPAEQQYLARQTVRNPHTSHADMSEAIEVLSGSPDWSDRDLARQFRETKVANDRITSAERGRALAEGRPILFGQGEAAAPNLSKTALLLMGVLLSALIAAFGIAASISYSAATTQAIDWRASL